MYSCFHHYQHLFASCYVSLLLHQFFPINPSGVGFSFRTVSRQSAITKPTRPGRANEEEAVYGGIAEPTGVDRAERCTGVGKGKGNRAITVHGDGGRVHGKVQARGWCTAPREGAGKGPGQRSIMVHGRGREGTGAESVHGSTGRCREGTGAESDNGARERCTGVWKGQGGHRGRGAITVHGDGARVYGRGREGTGEESDNGAGAGRGRGRER